MTRTTVFVLVACAVFLCFPFFVSGGDWNIQTVEWAWDLGTHTSLALDPEDNPCISYYWVTNGSLWCASRVGTLWTNELICVELSEYWSGSSLAVGNNGVPQVSYFGKNGTSYNLVWAWLDEPFWRSETIAPTPATACSLALDSSNYPHISFADSVGPSIRYTRWNGSTWVDEAAVAYAYSPQYTSLALDSTNTPHIAYTEYGTGVGLNYVYWTGAAWSGSYVPGGHDHNAPPPSIAMDNSDNPHIAFADRVPAPPGPRALKRAWYDGSWNCETIDATVDVGQHVSLAIGTDNLPRIAYYDATNGDLKFAFWFFVWWISTVDSDGDVGDYCSLALDSGNVASISYYDRTYGNLKYARWDQFMTTPTPKPTTPPAETPTPIPGQPTPTPVPAGHLILSSGDYDGDGISDIAIFRRTSGLWAVKGVTRTYFGSSSDTPISGDYDGDGTSDIGIFRSGTGLWAINGVTRGYFGSSSDTAVPGDYDGDGSCDLGIFRPSAGLWAVRALTRAYFGASADTPVPGYFDGDLSKDIGIFRGASGLWAIRGVTRAYFGSSSDTVVPGDYDGNGIWEVGMFRSSTGLWAIRGVTRGYFGSGFDQPVPADYSGDGLDDIGIFRETSGLWAISGVSRVYFGATGDIPVTR